MDYINSGKRDTTVEPPGYEPTEDNVAGLAANQIGYQDRVICIADHIADRKDHLIMVNPVIVSRQGGIKSCKEGCASRPGKPPIKVRRHKVIVIKWFDLKGMFHKETFKGFAARVIQHEIDHLNGVLI